MSIKIAGKLPEGDGNGLIGLVGDLCDNPHKVHQRRFAAVTRCGTTACIAGHALLLSGEYELGPMMPGDVDDFRRVDGTDDFVIASLDAQAILGLTDEQQETLFYDLQDKGEALDYLRGLLTEATR